MANEAFEIGRATNQPDALMMWGIQSAFARRYGGDVDENLIELTRRTVAAYPQMLLWQASVAQFEAEFGSREVASVILDEAVESRLEHLSWDPSRLTALAFYADASARLGRTDAAQLIYELLEPWHKHFIWCAGACGYGHVRLWLGLLATTLGRDAEADEHVTFSVRFSEDQRLPLWAARSHLAQAEALAARGDRDSASEHSARALELAREHGYGNIERGAAALIGTRSPVET
jgi:tetratricopeptide (TPR) repeat protein